MNNVMQLTIRGLDQGTKVLLIKKAQQQGVSLNRYVLQVLQQSTGNVSSEKRYQDIKHFLANHKIDNSNKKTFTEALMWSDKASVEKQSRE